ncbi:MAG: TM2 domain-containing protein [Planctomycetota bacterium]|nr:TM2 domain-containing protein [Planctomycetota bacterium]MEC8784304.1 TM2 domain-containing protein [Planctomycetota bacterium]MEC8864056.1 TM2 domain-containing protein [Planctomycetota bacterium]
MADQIPGADKKVTAGICGILLGAWGVHRFILGDATGGIIRIVLTLVTCGAASIIGLIEGIIYLTKSDEDFVNEYITNQKGWF